jgi:hypothetical protein
MAKVTLIKRSSPVCPGCNVMQIQLQGEGIEHNIIDITHDTDAIEEHNLTGVPVVLVQTDEGVKRFDGMVSVDEIKEAMGE